MSEITDRILSNIDIVDVVSKYVTLKRSGVNYSACCPFHSEKTPSFVVSPQKQIFKCFGCGMWGNAITFVKEIERADFWDTIKILAKDNNIDIAEYENKIEKNQEFVEEKQKIKYIHKLAQQFFLKELSSNEKAKEYLSKNRKLWDDIINRFGLGYANNTYYDLIEFLKSKGFQNQDLVKASLARERNSEIYSFFRNRITFPIYDLMWNIVWFSARILDPNDKPKYLNSSEHVAFEKSKILYWLNIAKEYIKDFQSLVVVEGQMDVIALYVLGFPIWVATSGTSMTKDHVKILKRYTDTIYLMFDNDKAGQEATIRAMKTCFREWLFPKIISLPEAFKDVDNLVAHKDWKQIFLKAKEDAKDALWVIIDKKYSQLDLHSPVEKQKFIYEIFSLIMNMNQNLSIQSHYFEILADKLWISFEVVSAQFRKFVKTDWRLEFTQINKKEEFTKYRPTVEILFYSLFYNNFLDAYVKTEELWNKLLIFVHNMSEEINDEVLKNILCWMDINSENKNEIEETQLWLEEELNKLWDEQKLFLFTKKILSNFLVELKIKLPREVYSRLYIELNKI